eukprot:4337410-Pleurochrysis_carterae.AAC.1
MVNVGSCQAAAGWQTSAASVLAADSGGVEVDAGQRTAGRFSATRTPEGAGSRKTEGFNQTLHHWSEASHCAKRDQQIAAAPAKCQRSHRRHQKEELMPWQDQHCHQHCRSSGVCAGGG